MTQPSRTTDWSGYEVFDPGEDVDRPLTELPRKVARAAYRKLMDSRAERIEQLRRLAQNNGVDLDAEDGLQQLNDWFVESLEENESKPGRLANRWYGVVNDIGILLGERAIAESGGKLYWEFYTWGKKNIAYQRHVIMGFNVQNPKYNVDFDRGTATYGHRIVKGADVERDFFIRTLNMALSKVHAEHE